MQTSLFFHNNPPQKKVLFSGERVIFTRSTGKMKNLNFTLNDAVMNVLHALL